MFPMSSESRAARLRGYIEALRDYAWWKDGIQYVGCGTKTLDDAIDQARRLHHTGGER